MGPVCSPREFITIEFLGLISVVAPPLIADKLFFGMEVSIKNLLFLNSITYIIGRCYWFTATVLRCNCIQYCTIDNASDQEERRFLSIAATMMRIGILHLFAVIPAYIMVNSNDNFKTSSIQAFTSSGSTCVACECVALAVYTINIIKNRTLTNSQQNYDVLAEEFF